MSSRDRNALRTQPGRGASGDRELNGIRMNHCQARLESCVPPSILESRDGIQSGQDLRTLVSLFLVLKRRGRQREPRLELQVRRRSRCGSCPVLNSDAARPAGLRPEPAAPSRARTALLGALTQNAGRTGSSELQARHGPAEIGLLPGRSWP